MWSKHDKDNLYTMNGDEPFTFLGKGAQFKGIIHFEGTIRIDGRLEGEIHTKGTLMVGEHAVIERGELVGCAGGGVAAPNPAEQRGDPSEIGRASCRERG